MLEIHNNALEQHELNKIILPKFWVLRSNVSWSVRIENIYLNELVMHIKCKYENISSGNCKYFKNSVSVNRSCEVLPSIK